MTAGKKWLMMTCINIITGMNNYASHLSLMDNIQICQISTRGDLFLILFLQPGFRPTDAHTFFFLNQCLRKLINQNFISSKFFPTGSMGPTVQLVSFDIYSSSLLELKTSKGGRYSSTITIQLICTRKYVLNHLFTTVYTRKCILNHLFTTDPHRKTRS